MAFSSQEDPPKSDIGSVQEIDILDPPEVISNNVVTRVQLEYRLYKRRFAGLVGFVSWP